MFDGTGCVRKDRDTGEMFRVIAGGGKSGAAMNLKTLSTIVSIVVALFTAAFTVVQFRSQCGNISILQCVSQAVGLSTPDATTAEQRKLIDDARAAEARYKRELEEHKRKAELAEAARKAAEERSRAEEARRDLEERERKARDTARARAAEEEQKRKTAAAQKVLPNHKFWQTAGGSVVEYRQVEGSVVMTIVRPSTELAASGGVPGARWFVGYYDGTGNEVKGTSLAFARPGCTVSVPNAVLKISPNQIVLNAPQGPRGCGYDFTHRDTVVYIPAAVR